MAISERELHPYIKGLVEEHGVLTVTDLNRILREMLELDETDLTILEGRKDDKFSQIIRNIVSHTASDVSSINGYIVDKRKKPAKFYAIAADNFSSANPEEKIITKNEINERQTRKRKFDARKVDFIELNKERSELGKLGEIFALDWERERLKKLGVKFDVLEEVIHFSERYGDGAGYDILSRQGTNYKTLYIEVKTTKRGFEEPFFMTINEKVFFDVYDNVKIYRVYNFDKERNFGDLKIIDKDELNKFYEYDSITFKVSLKK